ncbi:phosphate ABC transporter permease subunit PstC [Acidihalobacter ferrooxydans]|uniref:Phosphate transport system permease protein n=1 Tax=Acidihalobacter ferrooxydans TaxID=1765967 RepID=A0A1P8UFW1_9GAMM|nr:phosphate ABC transporter permease subunit PstC [Acidihalobacter ferrooxydans]APZ42709.1 phosphate ABC transporter permease subunit PstC [Acidihalobacter ferrooxydans]
MSANSLFASAAALRARRLAQGRRMDRLFRLATVLFAWGVLLVLGAIIVVLLVQAWPAFSRFGFGFFTSTAWNPVTENYGAASSILGTLVTAFIAIALAVPISFGIALFLTELSPRWLRRPIGIAVELLAGIPSIIYGIWGLFIFAPWFADNVQWRISDTLGNLPAIGPLFQGPPIGLGWLVAGLVLTIMIIPFIAAVMRDVFDVVPTTLKESAYAMGSTRWEVMRHIVLPYTSVGVIGGIMLGLGRALGETMAVTFVVGNAHDIHASLFMPGNTIASTIANEFTEATTVPHRSALIALGLILFIITFVVLALAKFLLLQVERGQGQKA